MCIFVQISPRLLSFQSFLIILMTKKSLRPTTVGAFCYHMVSLLKAHLLLGGRGLFLRCSAPAGLDSVEPVSHGTNYPTKSVLILQTEIKIPKLQRLHVKELPAKVTPLSKSVLH